MPIFEFECPTCQRRIERIFRNVETADATPVLCLWIMCGGMKRSVMRRVPTAANFDLKGSGFHKNDYAKK